MLNEGREGVKWELGLAIFWTGKMGFTHWDWDLATGNGMNNYKIKFLLKQNLHLNDQRLSKEFFPIFHCSVSYKKHVLHVSVEL